MSVALDVETKRHAVRRIAAHYDLCITAILALFYLGSFNAGSQIFGPEEVFNQDTPIIIESLANGEQYRWNAQNHLLFHVAVEQGFRLWQSVVPIAEYTEGEFGAYTFLKFFTAACALAFLLALRWLLVTLRLDVHARAGLIALTGVSVSAWFHFAAFETHALAAPAICIYLATVARLAQRENRTPLDRALFVMSLVVTGLVRIDLFRFAAASALLVVLPSLRSERKSLLADLAIVAILGVLAQSALSHVYFGSPSIGSSLAQPFEREDRADLAEITGRLENFTAQNGLAVGRAAAVYSVLMPVKQRSAGETFFGWPPYGTLRFDPYEPSPQNELIGLFNRPISSFFGYGLSSLALLVTGALLFVGALYSVRHAIAGDALHVVLVVQWLVGWALYTWFNPFEPFLWVFEFLLLQILAVASALSNAPSTALARYWPAVAAIALLAHNYAFFYRPFD